MSKKHYATKPDRNGVVWTRSSISTNKTFTHAVVVHYPERSWREGHSVTPAHSRVSFSSSLQLARGNASGFKPGVDVEILEVEVIDKPLKSKGGRAV